uniref:Uncharacterized protein n=1 Tax=Chromera velia CCMP2878 TaxID=1169474 RepID=A0A0G4IFT5_9ALVE|eukprot:Cvel_14008.t1-p1 / transcript=Cvel_14008.t1 / gene=Cvel_14008 / organism=Chromera_velia_CCMP2878 / gene_product=hypothetical protein / transcript_product=hypothetical protein / location=Cvel_scaffold980:36113-38325(+) / protein_length=230 / sequence_SO=supercontig / SO=protein_coding / is_pseudo=false
MNSYHPYMGAANWGTCRQEISSGLRTLYSLSFSGPEDPVFDLYRPDCIFEDPAACLRGREEIRVGFCLAKRFLRGKTEKFETVQFQRGMLVKIKETYTVIGSPSLSISLPGCLWVEFDDEGRIVRHLDLWHGKRLAGGLTPQPNNLAVGPGTGSTVGHASLVGGLSSSFSFSFLQRARRRVGLTSIRLAQDLMEKEAQAEKKRVRTQGGRSEKEGEIVSKLESRIQRGNG